MAEILKFLTQEAHKSKAKEAEKAAPARATRTCINDYRMLNEAYRLPLGKQKIEGGDMQQFCSFYYKRLE
jgi:hypothetical protein